MGDPAPLRGAAPRMRPAEITDGHHMQHEQYGDRPISMTFTVTFCWRWTSNTMRYHANLFECCGRGSKAASYGHAATNECYATGGGYCVCKATSKHTLSRQVESSCAASGGSDWPCNSSCTRASGQLRTEASLVYISITTLTHARRTSSCVTATPDWRSSGSCRHRNVGMTHTRALPARTCTSHMLSLCSGSREPRSRAMKAARTHPCQLLWHERQVYNGCSGAVQTML